MRSIRGRLLLWLLPGFVILWFGAGFAIDFAVRDRLESRMQADLRELSGAIPLSGRAGTSLLSMEDFERDDFGIYFQIWARDGGRLLKSKNLGRFELARPNTFSTEPVYSQQLLGNGDSVETLALRPPGGSLGTIDLMVAKTRVDLDSELSRTRIAILAVGALAGIGFWVLTTLALRSGLRPLAAVGDQAVRIDADSLGARFPGDLPAEIKPITAKLDDLLGRLEESFARERRFSADLAHELRTPVAALRTIAEVALKWPDDATSENYDDVIEITGELQTTIENMLSLARLENAKADVSSEPVNVRAVIEDCWLMFAPKAAERRLEFHNSIDGDSTLETDPKLFRVIVSNLLSNAAEYAPHETRISLDFDDSSGLRISNPAPHLTESDLPRMFDRLWRHDQARSDSSHSGLGLSLAKTCAAGLDLDLRATLDESGLVHFNLSSSCSPQVGDVESGQSEPAKSAVAG
ncbi:MAG: signal transduction histidine kinase [Verrucomicrobiales bacterium]|jgi:signal transduction histidine kinase